MRPLSVNSTNERDFHGDEDVEYYSRGGNSSFTTSVTIHVTPEQYHVFNWTLLWVGFLAAIFFASYQVRLENRWFAAKEIREDPEQSGGVAGYGAEGEGVSTADWMRSRFRRLLLLAMLTRTIMMPVQMWFIPIWIQFIADTLPDMVFASAWTLLMSFFVQLVGLATGTGTSTSPGIVIQITAYVLYFSVLGTYFWNPLASILLYALLCCIYAALFGTALYFCPKLLLLLKQSLLQHHGLAIRLTVGSVLCVVVFGCRLFGFARKVVSPPKNVSWLWQYGCLELLPSAMFLAMMHPKTPREMDTGTGIAQNHSSKRSVSPASGGTPPTPRPSRHTDESGRGGRLSGHEATPLLKNATSYGAAIPGTTSTNSGDALA